MADRRGAGAMMSSVIRNWELEWGVGHMWRDGTVMGGWGEADQEGGNRGRVKQKKPV